MFGNSVKNENQPIGACSPSLAATVTGDPTFASLAKYTTRTRRYRLYQNFFRYSLGYRNWHKQPTTLIFAASGICERYA